MTLASPTEGKGLRGLAWRLSTTWGLVGMFTAAFGLRVAIAPYVGFHGDLGWFRYWAQTLAVVGPHDFYERAGFADYPPGYLYVLWLIGKLQATPSYLLLKLPALLGDLALAWIAGTLAERIAPKATRERWPVRTLVAAAVLFNPAVLAIGAVWGQVDVIPAALALWSLLLLFTGPPTRRRELAAYLIFTLSVSIKPQAAVVLPVVLYACYRRHLRGRPRAQRVQSELWLALLGVLCFGLWALLALPFSLGPPDLIVFYKQSASQYPITSANAFNVWGAVGFNRHDAMGDDVVALAGIPAIRLGMIAFLLSVAFVLWRTHRAIEDGADDGPALVVASASTGLLAFALLTRMHERYMFTALAMLAPLVFERRLRLAYAALSFLFVVNLWFPYAVFNHEEHVEDLRFNPVFDWIYGADFALDTWQKKIWSLVVTAVILLVAARGLRWIGARPVRRRKLARNEPASEVR